MDKREVVTCVLRNEGRVLLARRSDDAETAARREIDPNWGLPEYEWIHATEIRRRETGPDLWQSYERVRPTVETVAADDEHGSARLSVRALEVLRDAAALAGDWDGVADVARELLAARPSMAVIENWINRVTRWRRALRS